MKDVMMFEKLREYLTKEYMRLSDEKEEIAVVEVSLERSECVRRIWPFLRDRRIDFYGDIVKRYRD